MSALGRALFYLDRFCWPIFPRPNGRYIRGGHGWRDASTNPEQINEWWGRYPNALIAMPTGSPSGIVILDIDRKHGVDGFATLEKLGRAILPDAPLVHTPSGGTHVYFSVNPAVPIGLSHGKFGLGDGLDVLGNGGNAPLPTPGWRYRWDSSHHPGSCGFPKAPRWLALKTRQRSARGEELLDDACANIRQAGPGERHAAINRAGFFVGALVSSGALDRNRAWHSLQAAVTAMTWTTQGNARKARYDLAAAFRDGQQRGGRFGNR